MKKQIFTLTLCLALTATSALAAGTTTVAKKAAVKTTTNCVKAVKPAVKTPEVVLTPEQLAKKNVEEKLTKERECLFSKLGLTAEQKTKSEPAMAKVQAEKAKLKEMKAKKACPVEVLKQKKEVRKAQKEFRATLSQDQLTKLKTLKKGKCKCHNKLCAKKLNSKTKAKCPCKKK